MFLLFLFLFPVGILGHGSLIDPPSRAAMNKFGFPENPVDNNYNQGFCGGFSHQHSTDIGGRCGICGDAWDANPREHEAPRGKYANGIITGNYQPGSDITVTVLVTANHQGFFIFRLCKNNNVGQDPDQTCFEAPDSLLKTSASGNDRFYLTTEMRTGQFEVTLKLPNLACDQCILQWTYTAGNNWGLCLDGTGKLGCGPQETFRACSDISIGQHSISNPTSPSSSSSSSETSTASEITTSSSSTISTTSPSSPPSPPISGQACVALGPWAGDASMAHWCYTNCYHVPPHCPADRCDCLDNQPSVETKECVARGPWTGNAAINSWCNNNCNNQPSYCPSSMCQC